MSGRLVTSLANPTVKAVRALHMRRAREESGLFLVEGLRSISEAVELGHAPRILLHAAAAADHPLLVQASAKARETLQVTEAILAKISRRENPQMVLGVFERLRASLGEIDLCATRSWVGLEAVRDPGNLGTIIRTADAAGCGGVILIGDCCDPYSVEAVRATMGSVFAIAVIEATREAFLDWRPGWRGAVVGTLLSATTDFREAPYRDPNLILLGNEQAGLTATLAEACDLSVKIPMRGRADSLNLAVAAGVMIYAATAPT